MQEFDVIVIGAGAAGLMCAIEAGKRGRRVLVLDHANRIGKKILLSGGGRCNFTNVNTGPANFLSRNPHFTKSALARYTPADFITMVKRHNIPFHEKKLGQLFCDRSAKDIVQMLAEECKQAGVRILTRCDINEIDKDDLFRLVTSLGEFHAGKLVIATGGLSFPTMGASSFGYQIARQFGLNVLPTRAALVPLLLSGEELTLAHELSGVAVESEARFGKHAFRENLLFTHRGLSGPAILQISSYWEPGKSLQLKLLPETNAVEWLLNAKRAHPKRFLKNLLSEYLPSRLIEQLNGIWFHNAPLADCRDADLTALGHKLSCWSITPSGTEGYRTAEVTLGGVDTNELSSKNMESKKVPGLYFVGEVVDVTGWLGGYNFQWAWSSGWSAGQAV